MKSRGIALLGLVLIAGLVSTRGQEAVGPRVNSSDAEAPFVRRTWALENLVGTFFLFDRGGNARVTVDYALYTLRAGVMLYDPSGSGILRGNTEVLGEVFAGPIFQGPGSVATGLTLFLRYNFVQPGARLVPYFQVGGGGVYSDIEHGAPSGNAISLSVNFNLQATAGLRFEINRRWSALAEATYRHISNAGLHDPNYGIDQLGGALGLSCTF
jgi:hypothetical protein